MLPSSLISHEFITCFIVGNKYHRLDRVGSMYTLKYPCTLQTHMYYVRMINLIVYTSIYVLMLELNGIRVERYWYSTLGTLLLLQCCGIAIS